MMMNDEQVRDHVTSHNVIRLFTLNHF